VSTDSLVADVTLAVVLLLLVVAGVVFAISKLRDRDVPAIGKRKLEVPVFLALAAFVVFPISVGFRIAAETTRVAGRASVGGVVYVVIFLVILPLIWLAASRRFRPVVTAVVLAYGFAVLLETFTLVYWSHGTSRNFGMPLSHFDAFYFALGTLTTGTGNISAVTEASRRIQTTQMVIDLAFIGFIVALLMARYSTLLDRPHRVPPPVPPPEPPPEPPSEPPPGPTGESLVTQLVEGLRAAAGKESNQEREKELQQAADLLGGRVRAVVVDVAAKVVEPAAGS